MSSDCRRVLVEALKLALRYKQDVHSYIRFLRVTRLRYALYCESYSQLTGLEHYSMHYERLDLYHGMYRLSLAAERLRKVRAHLGGVD